VLAVEQLAPAEEQPVRQQHWLGEAKDEEN